MPIATVGLPILAVGYFVSQAAASHPIGTHIPDKRLELRDQGCQEESVRSGKESPSSAVDKVGAKVKGGDNGLKEI